MKSYPASCDYMVARPPTYEESMYRFRNTQPNMIRPPYIVGPPNVVRPPYVVRPHNTVRPPYVVRPHNTVRPPNVVRQTDTQQFYYRPHPRNTRQRLCNIL